MADADEARGVAVLMPSRCGACSYWSDAAAHLPDGRMIWLGGLTCTTAERALAWIGRRADQVADQLGDHLARPVRAWSRDAGESSTRSPTLATGAPTGSSYTTTPLSTSSR
ncbi:hypothetical protein ACFVTY_31115 [Streptomyces sp. NPDC058067]|uniref:hypothetical protein n=1 Tax=Streptomyces sp. NPDC058067 TaxID=3346324 RepID=UPI0036EA0F65